MTRDNEKSEHEKGQPSIETSNANLGADTVAPLNFLESYSQRPGVLAYQDNPDYQGLLLNFQNAEWNECLKKIDRLLLICPDDSYLLSFKQEVEIRVKLQAESQVHQTEEKRRRFLQLGFRALLVILLGLVVYLLFVLAGNIYQANKLKQEANLTAEALAAKYQTAENFMNAGRVDEALGLYNEIQKLSPTYKDVEQKIQLAEQAQNVADLYTQGSQAFLNGDKDKALEILSTVEKLHPNYKDAAQLIQKIEKERQIVSLVKEIQDAYSRDAWEEVIQKYDTLRSIDSSIYTPELKDILFTSYRKLILDKAGRSDLTLEDIETVERYYRDALSLFPQNKDYAAQRDELQKIAVELLASKYYLLGMNLLEGSNYSLRGLQQAVQVLTKANNIGTSSPAISAEIEKAQLFLSCYDDILHYRWDHAITGLEKLLRKDENYADGRVKYFLYEAYIARGDLLLSNADFEGALSDYQDGEKFAWGDKGNLLRLFQVEVRIANVLHKLGQDKDASDFYHNIFERLNYRTRLTTPDEQELLNTLIQADLAYKSGNPVNTILLYQTALKQKDKLYDQQTISVNQGATLVNLAFENNTSMESLRSANHFGECMVVNKKQDIIIPLIPSNGQ